MVGWLPTACPWSGLASPHEDVPGRGDGQKREHPGDRLQLSPAPPLAGEQQVRNGRADKKDWSNQSLGQQRQRQRSPHHINARRPARLQAGDQPVKRDEQKQAENRLGNDEPRKEKRPNRGEHAQSGIEPGARAPGPPCPNPRQPGQPQHCQRVGQVGSKGVLAKDAIGDSHQPVGQRRLLNIAYPIDFAGDPVAGLGNMLRRLGVRCVHVVHQRRRKQRGKINGEINGGKK